MTTTFQRKKSLLSKNNALNQKLLNEQYTFFLNFLLTLTREKKTLF